MFSKIRRHEVVHAYMVKNIWNVGFLGLKVHFILWIDLWLFQSYYFDFEFISNLISWEIQNMCDVSYLCVSLIWSSCSWKKFGRLIIIVRFFCYIIIIVCYFKWWIPCYCFLFSFCCCRSISGCHMSTKFLCPLVCDSCLDLWYRNVPLLLCSLKVGMLLLWLPRYCRHQILCYGWQM